MIERGGIYWADLGAPTGSAPAKRRPVLVVQSDSYNASGLATVIAVALTSKTAYAAMPGNVFIPKAASGLRKDSVANVTALVTLDKTDLDRRVGDIPAALLSEVEAGLRRVLGL